MVHYFDVDIAAKYGVNAAIIFQNIANWVQKNEANGKNFYDGSFWTYNSISAFTSMLPYLSAKQIRTAINSLIENGLVKTGNYNLNTYDRTMWYALTEQGRIVAGFRKTDAQKTANAVSENGESICPETQIHLPCTANGFATEGEPIPIETNNKPVETSKERRKKQPAAAATYDDAIDAYTQNQDLRVAIFNFVKMRAFIKKPLTDRALKMIMTKLDNLSADNDDIKIKILDQSIVHNWQDVYQLKQDSYGGQSPQQFQQQRRRQGSDAGSSVAAGTASFDISDFEKLANRF